MSIRVEDFDSIDFSDIATGERVAPVHPGEILMEEFLEPMEISQNRIARDIGVPPRRINEIVLGKRSLTADTALRLGAYFNMSPQFWVNLQSSYDLAAANAALGDRLREEVKAFA
ncbi:MAG: HigA family addiction module antitoxin [Candidatus Thiodiazotropha endolucinida]